MGEFYSVALANHRRQADTGTKMMSTSGRTRARHFFKASAPAGGRTPTAAWSRCSREWEGARNYSQCDSRSLIGDRCGAHTFPYIEVQPTAKSSTQATTSRISDATSSSTAGSAGISDEDAVSLIVNGFAKQVLKGVLTGVRGGGAEAAGHVAGELSWRAFGTGLVHGDEQPGCTDITPKVTGLRATNGQDILKGLDLAPAGRGARHHGRTAMTQAGRGAGRPAVYQVTAGRLRRTGPVAAPGSGPRGVFLGFQYPVEIPGVGIPAPRLNAIRRTLLGRARRHILLRPGEDELLAPVNEGFSGGEKKAKRDFTGGAEPRSPSSTIFDLGPGHWG